ncbi:peptidase [Corallococcus praedator]|uniref:Peptidase n=1 Tax=Corallococcus praedator TaxID=2316724 RepID=A0ABX9QM87_9BACT|nr:peptidase [Corallococcus sp. CA031C]RKI10332.1 peptidase [Corallococcus praedator]
MALMDSPRCSATTPRLNAPARASSTHPNFRATPPMRTPRRGHGTNTRRGVYSAPVVPPRPVRDGMSDPEGSLPAMNLPRLRPRAVLPLLLVGLLTACATSRPALGPVDASGPEVWRSRGYGWLLTVTPEGLRLHHETAAGCSPDPASSSELKQLFGVQAPGPSEGVRDFFPAPGETRYRFDRIAALPEDCDRHTVWSAPKLFNVFQATFAEHYAYFPERGPEWLARLEAERPRVSPGMEGRALFTLFAEALRTLGDAHVALVADDASSDTLTYEERATGTFALLEQEARRTGRTPKAVQKEWLGAYRDGILQTVLRGQGHHVANQRVFWGFAAPGVGYLNVMTMGGFVAATDGDDATPEQELAALEPVLDEAMAAFAGATAVIVDVSNNRGGHDVVARAIAARFADRPRLAYSKWAKGAKDVPPQEFILTPTSRPAFHGPVHLVTSDITVSAGEVFTLAMRALPQVRHVGTRTRGSFSDVLVKPLPNGWTVHLSNEHYTDPKGEDFEARGAPPQQPLDVFPEADLSHGHARAMRALADSLEARGAK